MDDPRRPTPLAPGDREWVRRLTCQAWGDETVVAHGVRYYPDALPGLAIRRGGEVAGFLTYTLAGGACEIVTLLSLVEGQGIGTALIRAVEDIARQAGCQTLWLITTNNNLKAMRFYQKRGFHMTAVYPDAVTASRRLKPSIPALGDGGIPIRDEIRFEKQLLG